MSRPRSFDETAVRDAALGRFWGRGYEATSIRDLTEAMGISGASLYNAFGDKRGLFLEALQHYCLTRTYPMLARIERKHEGAAAVRAFFSEITERSLVDRERRGCFLINSALEVAPHDKAVRTAVSGHLREVRAFLVRQLASCNVADTDATADHLIAVLLGIRVLARTRPERALLEGIITTALAPMNTRPAAAMVNNRRRKRVIGAR